MSLVALFWIAMERYMYLSVAYDSEVCSCKKFDKKIFKSIHKKICVSSLKVGVSVIATQFVDINPRSIVTHTVAFASTANRLPKH